MAKARINLASIDINKLNQITESIKEIAKKTKVEINGPIPLPTHRLRLTTRKTPCGSGSCSYDRFEMRVHKRLIDLGVNDRALRLIMRVPIPEGVQIQIEMME